MSRGRAVAAFVVSWLALSGLAAAPAWGETGGDLEGSRWAIVEVYGEKLAQDEEPHIAFEERGQISGRTACNWFHGTYAVEADAIVILTRLTTLRGCLIDNRRRSDATLEALDSSARFAVAGSALTLSDEAGEPVARLERLSGE